MIEHKLFAPKASAFPIKITSYHWPDLDGIASAYALKQLLLKKNCGQAEVMFSQTPQKEALWVMEQLHLSFPFKVEEWMKSGSRQEQVILVDASDPQDLPSNFPLTQIQAVIDHRSYSDVSSMPLATCWIDPVGSNATLIGELYVSLGIEPDKVSANLLYAAIMSNTVELSSGNTTQRDRFLIHALQATSSIRPDFVKEMFQAKSCVRSGLLYDRMNADLSTKSHNALAKRVA